MATCATEMTRSATCGCESHRTAQRNSPSSGRSRPWPWTTTTAIPTGSAATRQAASQARPPATAPGRHSAGQSAAEWPPRLSDYPLQHPYSPIKDLDAADFLAKHPTWDGRGVTIALLDGNLDLLLPEFQTAYTSTARPVPKIADYLNVTDPRDDGDMNPQWVDMAGRP